MKLYGAIDLHSNNNLTVLIDEQDQVVYQKRLPNDLSLITQQLSAYQDALQGLVVESREHGVSLGNMGSRLLILNFAFQLSQ